MRFFAYAEQSNDLIHIRAIVTNELVPSGYSYTILKGEILPETIGPRHCFALRMENGDIYGIDKGDKMIKIRPGFFTVIVEDRLTKDLPCGKNVAKTYNLVSL